MALEKHRPIPSGGEPLGADQGTLCIDSDMDTKKAQPAVGSDVSAVLPSDPLQPLAAKESTAAIKLLSYLALRVRAGWNG